MNPVGRAWSRLRGRRHGGWMWTTTGAKFYPLDPRPEEVRVADVARGIACEARYAGQIRLDAPGMIYSVAEHSFLVSTQALRLARERGWRHRDCVAAARWGHWHDATEAYIGDVIRPLKYQREMRAFRKAEALVERAIVEALSIERSPAIDALVDEVDARILTDEIAQLICSPDMDRVRARFGESLGVTISCWDPREAEKIWLAHHAELEHAWASAR